MPAVSVRPLCPELAKKAQLELNETPQKLEDGINHLKEWIAKQPHLRARTDDQWLAVFLRGCKHSLEKTKAKLDLYYSMRSFAPDMFEVKFCDPKFEELLRSGTGLPLTKRKNPGDPTVMILRASAYDPDRFQTTDFFSIAQALLQVTFLEDDNFMVAGCVLVFDLTGATMGHLAQMTTTNVKKLVMFTQDASPNRLVAAHFIGMTPFYQVVFNIGKQFLSEKNKEKLIVHSGGFEDLHKYISPDILPQEYGGNGETFQEITDLWVNKVNDYSAYLKEDLQYGTDETKRPGKPRTAESILGADGFFRQLDFD